MCGVRARRSDRALKIGIAAISVSWVAAGAAVNAAFLLSGSDYSGFADVSPIPFVHDRWESLAVPLVTGLLLLYRAARAERITLPRPRPSADASSAPRHRSPRSRVPSP